MNGLPQQETRQLTPLVLKGGTKGASGVLDSVSHLQYGMPTTSMHGNRICMLYVIVGV